MEDPTKQPPLEAGPPVPLRGSRDLFDINVLPARYRRKKLTLIGLLPWLLLIVLLGTIYPSYTLAIQSQGVFQDSRQALAQVQADLEFYQDNSQEQEGLQVQIEEAQAQKEAILQSFGGLKFSTFASSPTLYQINQLLPEGASWTQISQLDQTLRLDGVATEYQLVIRLRDSLKDLDTLGIVEIETIEQLAPEETSALSPEEVEADASGEDDPPILYSFTIRANLAGEVAP